MPVTSSNAVAFVESHGIVLESGRGPVPNLAEAVAGAPIRGSWWGHTKGHEIFAATRVVRESPEVLVCRLLEGKVTYCGGPSSFALNRFTSFWPFLR